MSVYYRYPYSSGMFTFACVQNVTSASPNSNSKRDVDEVLIQVMGSLLHSLF